MTDRDAAFRDFFQAEQRALQRFATFMTGDSDAAYDLVQEAFVRTYRAWKKAHLEDPGVYARRVIVNLIRDHSRRRKARLLRPWTETRRTSPSPADEVVQSLVVVDAMNRLPVMRRAVVTLRFYEDMSEQQIADALDRPLGTVKSDLHRALNALRPIFEEIESTVGGEA
jgi:RNA polymerase sigma-70 factor (sigma-E family)